MKNGFEKAERVFLSQYATTTTPHLKVIDKSGSCAVALLIVDSYAYTANVGDSRAIMSTKGGKETVDLTSDHKPSE
ncbi:MAG: hypothetical protein JKY48_09650 [Flavobacteriales bacterium]|nr:hypothetical protein [Flavobacteriales bacterium]